MPFVLDMQLGNLLRFVVLIFSPLPVSVKTVQSIFIQYKSEQMQPGFFFFFLEGAAFWERLSLEERLADCLWQSVDVSMLICNLHKQFGH